MKRLLLDLCKILALASLLACCHWSLRKVWQPPAPASVPVEFFLQHREDYALVDARVDAEFESGHIPGAINLSVSQALQKRRTGQSLLPWPRSQAVLVYCDGESCKASTQVGLWLREQGYKVKILAGGYPGWLAAQGKKP